jgi:hypothetical protein
MAITADPLMAATFSDGFKADLARLCGCSSDNVTVDMVLPGSLLVAFTVYGPKGAAGLIELERKIASGEFDKSLFSSVAAAVGINDPTSLLVDGGGLVTCPANSMFDPTGSVPCKCDSGFYNNGTNGTIKGKGFAQLKADQVSCAPINQCADGTADCEKRNANCAFVGPEEFVCSCKKGFGLTAQGIRDGDACAAIDICAMANGGCDQNADCKKTAPGTNNCTCITGYEGDGTECYPINTCAKGTAIVPEFSQCVSTGAGTNSHTCNVGYQAVGKSK